MAEGQYVDDPSIPGDAALWRRIRPKQWVFDENQGRWRPSSQNFKDVVERDGAVQPVSAYLETDAPSLEFVLADHPGYGIAAVSAAQVREHGRGIQRDYEDGRNPGHCLLFLTEGRPSKRTDTLAGRLARLARWVVWPPEIAPGNSGGEPG